MFDIGFSELVIIAVVALIVLGPERLPRAARLAGLWVRRARAQWYSVKTELERELAAEDLKRSVDEAKAGFGEVETQLRAAGQQVQRQLDDVREQARSGLPERSAPQPPEPPTAPAAADATQEPRP